VLARAAGKIFFAASYKEGMTAYLMAVSICCGDKVFQIAPKKGGSEWRTQ
jgi:hypothetical protein